MNPFGGRLTVGLLSRPAAWFIIASNVLPIIGVLAWNWDAFLVLFLFWCETGVIGFWVIALIATRSREQLRAFSNGTSEHPLGTAAFFAVHSGIFMTVHAAILWQAFGGSWRAAGIDTFLRYGIVGSGVWIGILLMFCGHGLRIISQFAGVSVLTQVRRIVWGAAPVVETQAETERPHDRLAPMLASFYRRIIVMQVALILGAMLATALGTMAPLLILIAIKILAEIGLMAEEQPATVAKPKP